MYEDDEKIRLMKQVKIIPDINEDKIPFPQANSIELLLKALYYVYSDVCTPSLISQCMQCTERVGKYYIDALRYLGLAEKSAKDGNYYLTDEGFLACSGTEERKKYRIARNILKHEVFNKAFAYYLENNELASIEQICKYLIDSNVSLSDDTLKRRASTVRGWVQWLIDLDIKEE